MSDDLISRKAIIDYLREQNNNVIIEKHKGGFVSEDTCRGMESAISAFRNFILTLPTAFDKEKVIEELKSWEKASHDAGIQSTYAELDNKASGYYQESRAYHRAIKIVERGGIE